MILKIKRNNPGCTSESTWEFIDNINSVTAGIDGEKGEKLILCGRDSEFLTEDITNGCFLLNDRGKTIERLA